MMACVGDTICASPFAVLGSIGVITEQPNVYERLNKEGITFNVSACVRCAISEKYRAHRFTS